MVIDFPLIIYWVHQEIIMAISQKKVKKQVYGKISNFIVDRDYSYKK